MPNLHFDPRELGNCAIWLDASDYSTLTFNNTTISKWLDKSGNGNHANQATALRQPLYVASGINSLPALEGRHDGTNASQMVITDSASLNYTGAASFVVAQIKTDLNASSSVIAKYTLTGNQREWLMQVDQSADRWVSTISADGTATTNITIGPSSTAVINTPYIVGLNFTAGVCNTSVNNRLTGFSSASAAVFNGTSDVTIFSRPTISDPFEGRISEILHYNRLLTRNEYDAVVRYLAAKWNVNVAG